MKINSSERYLSLALNALETIIKPELQSSSAQATLGMINTALNEVLKREQSARVVLANNIDEGEALICEISAALDCALPNDIHQDTTGIPYQALSQRHETVTQQLHELCETLTEKNTANTNALLRKVAEWELSFYTHQASVQTIPAPEPEPKGSPLSQAALERFINHDNPDQPFTVSKFEPMTGGFGKQTFLCEMKNDQGQQREIVIRKSDPTPIMKHGACLLDNEYALLCALAATDYPAPKPIAFASGWEDVDGDFYTMDKIPGSVPGAFLGGMYAEVPESLFLELAELLAKLHTTPLETFSDYAQKYDDSRILKSTIAETYRYNLEAWQGYFERENHLPSPYLIWLFNWLNNHIPNDSRSPVLVHGDFNIHNILVDNNHISAVLDWECAGFGAPEQDLAYIKPHISEHIDWQRFIDHYQNAGGTAINEDAMAFGMAYAALRTNLAGNHATWNLQRGQNNDIRYAMVELGFTPSFMQLALNSAPE